MGFGIAVFGTAVFGAAVFGAAVFGTVMFGFGGNVSVPGATQFAHSAPTPNAAPTAPLLRTELILPHAVVILKGEIFRVEIAETQAIQARGLGGRKALAPHSGMLFVYAQKDRHSFWMKGMLIPLDIIWLNNHRVVHIAHHVLPPAPETPEAELPLYGPEQPANLVLEIPAGEAKRLGLRPGDRVELRF